MALGLASLVVASTLAFHPFSTGSIVRAPEPAPHPSWDEPEPATEPVEPVEPAEGTPPATDPAGNPADALAPAPAPVPAPAVVPVVAPGPMIVTRAAPPKGVGLMVAAGVTGGLAWLTVFGRLAAIDRCKTAAGNAVLGNGSGLSAASSCFRSAGSLTGLTVAGWLLNDVTYGLAPAAGVARGKYDGVNAAWDGRPQRKAPVLIGVGAGLLGAGVIGRIVTMVAFWRQLNIDRLFQHYPLSVHFIMAQLSAASIQGGAGMLGYGLAYKKARTTEDGRRKAAGLARMKLAPQLGWNYTGLSLVGRF
jgi:hypothetical protein